MSSIQENQDQVKEFEENPKAVRLAKLQFIV